MALDETTQFFYRRKLQKTDDIASGTRERTGRFISNLPHEFIFLVRLLGLLRGLTAELGVNCPILTILALHARVGIATRH